MAKTIFKTSEESNFILNMTEEQYAKLASYGLLAALFMVPVFTIVPEATRNATFVVSAGGLLVAGVIGMILALIAVIKKYIDKKVLLPVCTFTAMVLWGFVSMADSYDIRTGFYGYTGRGEGMLAIVFYLCFFLTALSIKREKAVTTLIDGAVILGLLNSAVGFIQLFTGKLSHYSRISINYDTRAVSGLSQSPIFMAMVFTLTLAAALMGFTASKDRKRSIFYLASACIFAFLMIHTYSLMGICGIVLGIVTAVVSVSVLKADKKKLISAAAVAAAAGLAVVCSAVGITNNEKDYRLFDGLTLWHLDAYQRISASGISDDRVDIYDTADVYAYLNDKTIGIIKDYSLTGTGPDQLAYPQVYNLGGIDPDDPELEMDDIMLLNKGTFDKVYNEYLYTAASRGIPSLIALVVLLISTIVIGYRNLKKERTLARLAPFMITLSGVIIFFIGVSNIAFTPVFWTFAGLSIASLEKVAVPVDKKSGKKRSK